MDNQPSLQPVTPKGIHIQVTEGGIQTADVRVPYFVVKMGLKFGQLAGNAKKKRGAEKELERLKEVDLDAIFEALNRGELTLPCLLVEVDEPDKGQHVKITLE